MNDYYSENSRLSSANLSALFINSFLDLPLFAESSSIALNVFVSIRTVRVTERSVFGVTINFLSTIYHLLYIILCKHDKIIEHNL